MNSRRLRLELSVALVVTLGTSAALGQAKPSVPPDTTPPQSSAAQPTLPKSRDPSPPKPGSPVVEDIVRNKQAPLDVRKASRPVKARRSRVVRSHGPRGYGPPVERPALAGVELVAPLPPPGEPPHIVVPTPAYPVESVLAGITTPPPPIVCHHTRRDPYAPDPHLYREQPVDCEPDNP